MWAVQIVFYVNSQQARINSTSHLYSIESLFDSSTAHITKLKVSTAINCVHLQYKTDGRRSFACRRFCELCKKKFLMLISHVILTHPNEQEKLIN